MPVMPNLGNTDRIVRLVIGLLLIVAPYLFGQLFSGSEALLWATRIIGGVLILTAFSRCCPLYRLLGVRTCKMN